MYCVRGTAEIHRDGCIKGKVQRYNKAHIQFIVALQSSATICTSVAAVEGLTALSACDRATVKLSVSRSSILSSVMSTCTHTKERDSILGATVTTVERLVKSSSTVQAERRNHIQIQ